MNKRETTTPERIGKLITAVYWCLLGVFAVLLVSVLAATEISGSQAATNPGFGAFNAQICTIINLLSPLIGALAVLVIIVAGIMYSLSQGTDKGAFSIATAKNMIVSALTGVALFTMGSFLLQNPCYSGAGILQNIFGPNGPTSSQTP